MIDDLPARFAHTAAAAEALEAVVGGVDPLYRPAEFLLGYTYLKRGDAENAERIFARLVGRIEDQQRQVINAARERWLRGSRWLPFARRIPLVREWIAYYADVVCDLFGGPWVRAAEAWAELSEREPSDAESRNLPAQISQTTREINVDMIALVVGDAARIAWGMRTSETLSQADARAFLEPYFDREEIQTFNADARMLGALSLSRDVERASASIRGTAVPAWSEGYGRLAKLRANRLAFWYKHSLGELDAQLKDEAAGGEHALDRVRQIARKLERGDTGAPTLSVRRRSGKSKDRFMAGANREHFHTGTHLRPQKPAAVARAALRRERFLFGAGAADEQ